MPRKVESLSLADMAALIGKTTETLRLWRHEGCPHVMQSGRPRFVPREVWKWREERITDRAAGNAKEAKARDRKELAEAMLKEIELEQLLGNVASVTDLAEAARTFVGGMAATITGRLAAFERRIVLATTAAEARAVADEIKRACLQGARQFADAFDEETELLEQQADDEGTERV